MNNMSIQERLRYRAMNDYMVDQNYLDEGKDMMEAAALIDELLQSVKLLSLFCEKPWLYKTEIDNIIKNTLGKENE